MHERKKDIDLQGDQLFHHHEVDEQSHKNEEEGEVDDGILDQRTQKPFPHREIAGQHVGLTNGNDDPARSRESGHYGNHLRGNHLKNKQKTPDSPREDEEEPVDDVPDDSQGAGADEGVRLEAAEAAAREVLAPVREARGVGVGAHVSGAITVSGDYSGYGATAHVRILQTEVVEGRGDVHGKDKYDEKAEKPDHQRANGYEGILSPYISVLPQKVASQK